MTGGAGSIPPPPWSLVVPVGQPGLHLEGHGEGSGSLRVGGTSVLLHPETSAVVVPTGDQGPGFPSVSMRPQPSGVSRCRAAVLGTLITPSLICGWRRRNWPDRGLASPIITESVCSSPTAYEASVLRGAVGQPPGPLLVPKEQRDSLMPGGTRSRDRTKGWEMAPSLHHPSPRDTSAPRTLPVTVGGALGHQ